MMAAAEVPRAMAAAIGKRIPWAGIYVWARRSDADRFVHTRVVCAFIGGSGPDLFAVYVDDGPSVDLYAVDYGELWVHEGDDLP